MFEDVQKTTHIHPLQNIAKSPLYARVIHKDKWNCLVPYGNIVVDSRTDTIHATKTSRVDMHKRSRTFPKVWEKP